jgi:hypothetical protein
VSDLQPALLFKQLRDLLRRLGRGRQVLLVSMASTPQRKADEKYGED